MEFKTLKKENATVDLTLTATPEEVVVAFEEAYGKARQKVKVPGFRQGKVPLDVLKRHINDDDVLMDAARQLLNNTLDDILPKLDPAPIELPKFEIESFDREKGAVYQGRYETVPEVKIGKYKKLKVTLDEIEVSDADVEEVIEDFRKRNAIVNTRDEAASVAEGDHIIVDIIIKSGNKTLYKKKDLNVRQGEISFPLEMNQKLIGSKANETVSWEEQVAADFPDPVYAGKNIQITLTVHQIMFTELPALTDDFAKEAGEYSDLADLRSKVKAELVKEGENYLKEKAYPEIIKQIVEDSKFVVPSLLIRQEFDSRLSSIKNRLRNKDLTLEEIARAIDKEPSDFEKELMESAEVTVKDRLALIEVAKKEEILAEETEIDELISHDFAPYLSSVGDISSILQNENVRSDARSRILFSKTMKWLLENSDVKAGKKVLFSEIKQQA